MYNPVLMKELHIPTPYYIVHVNSTTASVRMFVIAVKSWFRDPKHNPMLLDGQ